MSTNPKIENMLNLALDIPKNQLEKSPELQAGYLELLREWELIVRYSGSETDLLEKYADYNVTALYGNYAIMTVPQIEIDALANQPEIIYIEKPKRLYFAIEQAKRASCIATLYERNRNLTGKNVLLAVIDSGIDYMHPDFRNEDGTTRIYRLWDQTIAPSEQEGEPQSPIGYGYGTEYTQEVINEAIAMPTDAQRRAICPSIDRSGHGTHVTGIAAGNGKVSDGRYAGVAPESELVIVKLGNPLADSFPRTTQLMTAIDYVVKLAVERQMPIAVNISFGNSYGSHTGSSLLETYIDGIADYGQTSIVIGTGNEGATAGHTSGDFVLNSRNQYERQVVDFAVGVYETSFSIQIWKSYSDIFEIELIHPSGNVIGPFQEILGSQQFVVERTRVYVYYGEPSPYSIYQEIFIEFIPEEDYVDDGIWQVILIPKKIVQGSYNMWMPGQEVRGQGTGFLIPTEFTTLTIPSTARKAIAVSAYDSRYNQLADFSGRGYTWQTNEIKPTIAAPGVDITAAAPGNSYAVKSGTSMATPFVTGAAALLMQYGIVEERDIFLYGEKLKANLIRGARQLPAIKNYPNRYIGAGVKLVS